MRVLGAILAGGQSRRFGSDKAHAMLAGRSLFDRVVDILRPQTEGLVLCGRECPGMTRLADRPGAGTGPLGGLNAALHYAHRWGFDAVLCVPLDVHPLPGNLRVMLEGPDARVLMVQHAVGFWPSHLHHALERLLAQGSYAFRSWIEVSGAVRVSDEMLGLANINKPEDLRRLSTRL
jgi:molybdopterin-guanine dinucleotide biosynthesis protein A